MLIRITERCNFDCIHCMIKTKPDGEDMTLDTYRAALEFTKRNDLPFVLLSGGEPTLHPDLPRMATISKKQKNTTLILSNGTFLENAELKTKILRTKVGIQVTNDKRYYPRPVPIVKHPKILYDHSIRGIAPFHKALKNKIPITSISPFCFNLRSISRKFNSLKEVLKQLRLKVRMCTPSINPDGTIVAGEADSCAVVGTVHDNGSVILKRIQELSCTKCGLIYNLPAYCQDAIL